MTDDDNPSTAIKGNAVTRTGATCAISEETPAAERLFEIAKRWRMPLERTDGQSLRALAESLSLAIEHRIALELLDLEEIATLDLDTESVP